MGVGVGYLFSGLKNRVCVCVCVCVGGGGGGGFFTTPQQIKQDYELYIISTM